MGKSDTDWMKSSQMKSGGVRNLAGAMGEVCRHVATCYAPDTSKVKTSDILIKNHLLSSKDSQAWAERSDGWSKLIKQFESFQGGIRGRGTLLTSLFFRIWSSNNYCALHETLYCHACFPAYVFQPNLVCSYKTSTKLLANICLNICLNQVSFCCCCF